MLKTNQELWRKSKHVLSIPNIGPMLNYNLIVITDGYERNILSNFHLCDISVLVNEVHGNADLGELSLTVRRAYRKSVFYYYNIENLAIIPPPLESKIVLSVIASSRVFMAFSVSAVTS